MPCPKLIESEFLRIKFRNLHFKQVPRVMLTTKVSEETDAVFSKYDPYPWVVSNNRIEDDLKCLIKNKDLCMHVQNC